MRSLRIVMLVVLLAAVFAAGVVFGGGLIGAQAQEIQALRHFKCYNIQGPDPVHIVRLRDQFGLERRVDVGPPFVLCTPARKAILSGPAPLPFSGDHLVCYPINPPHDPAVKVALANQLQEFTADVGPSNALCVPTAKTIVNR